MTGKLKNDFIRYLSIRLFTTCQLTSQPAMVIRSRRLVNKAGGCMFLCNRPHPVLLRTPEKKSCSTRAVRNRVASA